jgi:fructokinase
MKILCFGEIIWDIFPKHNALGGAPLNFCAHAVKNGAEGYLISAVGNDELGRQALSEISKMRIDNRYISTNSLPTGNCVVGEDEKGFPAYSIAQNCAYEQLILSDEIYKKEFDALCFGTLAIHKENNINALSTLLKNNKFKVIFCDLNLRKPFYNAINVDFALSSCTHLKINEDELSYLFESGLTQKSSALENAFAVLCERYNNIQAIVYTVGEKGAYLYLKKSSELFFVKAKQVEVASTVGAGDCFGATLLTELLKETSNEKALEIATQKTADLISRKVN